MLFISLVENFSKFVFDAASIRWIECLSWHALQIPDYQQHLSELKLISFGVIEAGHRYKEDLRISFYFLISFQLPVWHFKSPWLGDEKKKNSHHTHLAWIIFFEHFQHRANSRAISCEAISNIHFQVIKSKHFLGSSCKDDMRNVKNAEDASIKKRQLSHLWHLCKGAFEMTSQFSYLWKSDKNLVTTFGLFQNSHKNLPFFLKVVKGSRRLNDELDLFTYICIFNFERRIFYRTGLGSSNNFVVVIRESISRIFWRTLLINRHPHIARLSG